MATLYYVENVHAALTRIPTSYFCIAQESDNESEPLSDSGNQIKPEVIPCTFLVIHPGSEPCHNLQDDD